MMVVYHETLSGTVTPRTLGPYEFITTPPEQLVLNAILDQAGVGDCISPGIRGLAEQTGVSRGLITDCLRTLANDGWIAYDGRWITLLRDPSCEETSDRSGDRSGADEAETEPEELIDQVIDHLITADLSDRSPDRSLSPSPILAALQRRAMRQNDDIPRAKNSDRSPDRSAHMVHDQVTTTSPVVVHESSTTGGSGGDADRSPDRPHPAAEIMAELGAHRKVVTRALLIVPPWTAQEVRDRWDYDQRRIAASDGELAEGIFFEALMAGQRAPKRRDPQLDPAAYAGDDLYRLGSVPAPDVGESLRDHAERITPPNISGADFLFVMQRLALGEPDAEVLAKLATRHRRPGGAP
jgi:hypothetical protein